MPSTVPSAGAVHPWFREEGRPEPSALRRLSGAKTHELLRQETAGLNVSLPGPALPAQPFVLPGGSYRELFDVSRVLLSLVRRAVLAQGGSWPARAEALGADPDDYPLLSGQDHTETEYCAMMARPDIVIGEKGPQLLGFDVGGTFAGPDETHALAAVWQRTHLDAGRAPFTGSDPLIARVRAYEDVCARLNLPKAVALIGDPDGLLADSDSRFHELTLEQFRARGFTADFFAPHQLPDALGRPGALRYPLGLRAFTLPDRRERGVSLEPVHRSQRSGFLLLPPQSSGLLANKKALALVSEGRPWMTRAERRMVERHLPWTRITIPGRTDWRERAQDLPALLLRERGQFVLKRAIGQRGREVLIGRHTGQRAWEEAVTGAFEAGDSVVQEFVEPLSCPMELTDGRATWTAPVAPVLSPMLFNGRAGGCCARFLPDGTSASGSGGGSRPGSGSGSATENAVLTWA
jgi:hypothetical protein